MARSPADPQVPGEVPAEEEESVTVPKSQLDALLADMAALKAQVAAGPARGRVAEIDLPDADSIDKASLTVPVLTRTGWLVPDKYGSNPNAPKV